MASKKGQYFSFDAIVAAVIFVLAISILSNHWFSLRAQMDEQTLFLQDEAIRLSEIFVSPGDYDVNDNNPNVKTIWYERPELARKAGFGQNGSFEGNLVLGYGNQPSIIAASEFLREDRNYDSSRLLLSTPVHYYVTFNLSITNPEDFKVGNLQSLPSINQAIGKAPYPESEVVKIVRPVAAFQKIILSIYPPQTKIAYYTGNMTIYVWMNSSRS